MEAEQDPFETLGLSKDAQPDEIKAAYRREAMRCHPDRSGDSSEATNRFHQVAEAYRRLTGRFTHDADTITAAQSGGFHKSTEQPHKSDSSSRTQNNKSEDVEVRRPFNREFYRQFIGNHHDDPKNINFYYQEVFRDLNDRFNNDQFVTTISNRYLNKVFRRSIYLLLLVTAVVFYLPGLLAFAPLTDTQLFQLPMMVLSLMLVWALYRKLWLLCLLSAVLVLFTQVAMVFYLPGFLAQGLTDTLLFSVALLLPFVLIKQYANRFYYEKASRIVEIVNVDRLKPDQKRLKLKRLGGTSNLAATGGVLLIAAYFFTILDNETSLSSYARHWLPSFALQQGDPMSLDKRTAMENMLRSFEAGEQAYHQAKPNYSQALNHYLKASDAGSLLADYKLAYMYLNGIGVEQSDRRALHYFTQVTEATLVAQPQELFLLTRWLGEAYNSLGIMYLAGFGTEKDSAVARRMFVKAREYGADNPTRNLVANDIPSLRQLVVAPDYR